MEATAQAQVQTDANETPALYALDWPEFTAQYKSIRGEVTGKKADGEPIRKEVTHLMRRPRRAVTIGKDIGVCEFSRFNSMIAQITTDLGVDGFQEQITAGEAAQWLWDRCATKIDGYAGLNGASEVDDGIRQKLNGAEKEAAALQMVSYRAELVEAQHELTFDGGLWCVRIWHGIGAGEVFVGDFYVSQWDEEARRAYKASVVFQEEKTEGKKRITTKRTNLRASELAFDRLFERVSANATIGGRPATKADLSQFCPLLKQAVMRSVIPAWENVAGN